MPGYFASFAYFAYFALRLTELNTFCGATRQDPGPVQCVWPRGRRACVCGGARPGAGPRARGRPLLERGAAHARRRRGVARGHDVAHARGGAAARRHDARLERRPPARAPKRRGPAHAPRGFARRPAGGPVLVRARRAAAPLRRGRLAAHVYGAPPRRRAPRARTVCPEAGATRPARGPRGQRVRQPLLPGPRWTRCPVHPDP